MELSELAELHGSLPSATNQVGEMQRRMQDAEERSRACKRALLAVAAQSALRAARLSVDAIQGVTDGARAALGRAEAACDARVAAEALADVHDAIAAMPHASAARIDVRDALVIRCLSRVGYRDRETFDQSIAEAIRRPLTEALLTPVHKAHVERFDLVPDRFPSNSVLQQRRHSRRRRLAAQLRPEITFFEHYISVACAPYDTSLFKIRSAIDRVWAICIAPIVRKLAHDSGLVHQTLAPEFGVNKIAAEATEGCVLEVGIGPTAAVDLRGVVDAEGVAYAIFRSA